MDMTAIASQRVVSNPAVCGGKPCIAGTRIRVQDVYVWHGLQGLSADEIVSLFPQLTMPDVYAALAYFWEHRDEIQQRMDGETERVERIKQQNPSLLQAKLAAKHASGDSVPSG